MGLDFELYNKRKDMSVDDFLELSYEEHNNCSLAYGRRSWELVYRLASKEDIDRGYGILTEDRWNDLMNDMKSIGEYLDLIRESFKKADLVDEVDFPEVYFLKSDKQWINKYEEWFITTFDTTPDLGYRFSVGYMDSFWSAKDKVNEVLNDPDREVLMIISY